jgi:Uma2 family endonuclease
MTIAAKPITAEALLAMGEDARRLELYDGELRTMSPANSRHGNIAVQIAFLLQQFVKPRRLGAVMVEGGFILARNPDTVVGPDVSFLRQSRIPPAGLQENFFEGHPDLAVEIISPTNPRRQLDDKMNLYTRHGTPLAWLVDPPAHTVDIYRPNLPTQHLAASDTITGEQVIPGFSCAVAAFFD